MYGQEDRFLARLASKTHLVLLIPPCSASMGSRSGFTDINPFTHCSSVSRGLSIRINGGNTKVRPVNVSDVAAAMFQMLDDASTAGQTYELVG